MSDDIIPTGRMCGTMVTQFATLALILVVGLIVVLVFP